jgi:WD repeat-containing protein 24
MDRVKTGICSLDKTDIEFRDSHALWVQHSSGTFAQLDLRNSYRPLDAVPSLAASWAVSDSLAFVTDKKIPWEVPYDDM